MLLRALLASVSLVSSAAAASPTEFLPPELPWRGSSEQLIAKPENRWITPAEISGLTKSPSYDETIAWLQRLADASPMISIEEFGRSPEGRPLIAVIVAKNEVPNVRDLAANGRPTVLAQAGIHSGEIDGKDAGMMLLRDIAFGGKAALLDRANFILVPIFNVDGHERASEWNRPNQRGPVRQGWRTTAQNINLNRDYAKAATEEMRAMLAFINRARPALYFDLHVTDGIDYEYDITFGFHGWDGRFAWSPRIAAWLDKSWRPAVEEALTKAGHVPGALVFAKNNRDMTEGVTLGPSNPRLSHGYGDLRHIPTVLVENHSLKSFRQRALGTYVLLEASLRVVAAHGRALRDAIKADESARPVTISANWATASDERAKVDFRGVEYEEYDSAASGRKEVRWLGRTKLYRGLTVHWNTKPGVTLRRPKAYWIPATHRELIETLQLVHGVEVEMIEASRTVEVEMYRVQKPAPAAQPFEGRHAVTIAGVKPEQRQETFPPFSARISTDQPAGDLIVALLEPESADSFFAWGYFPQMLQRTEYIEGYIIAPMADKMLAEDPMLKSEFEAKLAADEAFRAGADARLRWFYEKTRFYDERYLLYPVGIER